MIAKAEQEDKKEAQEKLQKEEQERQDWLV